MERLKLRVGVIVMHSGDAVGFYAEASILHWLQTVYLVTTNIIETAECAIRFWQKPMMHRHGLRCMNIIALTTALTTGWVPGDDKDHRNCGVYNCILEMANDM